jgi:uncharacterized repeat protein (TIGR01451 family)
VSLTLANPLPSTGVIVVTFPSTFTLSSGAATGLGGDGISAGGATVTVSGSQIVKITRTSGSRFTAGTTVTVELTNIKNPTNTAATGSYSVKTDNASGTTIEQDTSVTAGTILPGVLTSTNVEPESLTVSKAGDVDVSFTTANALPSDGQIVVTFPSGFTLSSGAATSLGNDGASFGGTATVGVSGSQIVTITRSGGSEIAASTIVTVELTNIKNPTSTGSAGTYSIKTDTSAGITIDELTTITADTIKAVSTTSGQTCSGPGCSTGVFSGPTTAAVPTTDLEITMTVSPLPGLVGSEQTYTMLVTNNGPLPSISTIVNDTLPANVTYISSTASQGNCNRSTNVVCQLGFLGSGNNATVTILVSLDSLGTNVNVATVKGNRSDPIPANNTTSMTTSATDPLTVELTYEPSGGVKAGDTLIITATFNREFTGEPTITIDVPGVGTITATMTGTGDGKVWTFAYEVPAEVEGEGTIVISTPGETVRVPTLVASTNVFPIKATGPTVGLSYEPEGVVREGDTLIITATFDQAITGTPTVAIDTPGVDLPPGFMTDSGDGKVWTFVYVVPAGSEGVTEVTIAGAADEAGTANLPASGNSFVIGVAEQSVSITYEPNRDLSAGDVLTITATFTHPPTGTPTISVDTEGVDLPATVLTPTDDPNVWTYTYVVPEGSDGEATVTIVTVDDEGNEIETTVDVNFVIDNTGPAAQVIYETPEPVIPGETVVITTKFSEPVVEPPTIAIDTTGEDLPPTPMTDSGEGTTWTFEYEVPGDSEGEAVVTISGGKDEAGNPNLPATNSTFTIQSTSAVTTLELSYNPERDVAPGETLIITVTFSAAVLGTPTIEIDTTGVDLSSVEMEFSGETMVWTFSYGVPDNSDGVATVTISGVADAAGKTEIPANNNTFVILTPMTDLTVTIAASPNPVSRRSTLTYTITISNIGTLIATGVTLTDTLPSEVL